jgi:hypothetical protein
MRTDLTHRLQCDCHDERCFIYFWLLWWNENDPSPMFGLNLQYSHIRLLDRLKRAWKLLRQGQWKEEADISINGFDKIRTLRDFLNTCLEQESK